MKLLSQLLLALLVLAAAVAMASDVPRLLSYQGTLTNSSGSPLASTTVSVQFTIYDDMNGGNVKWTETQSVTTDANGLFAVLLGSNSPVPDTAFNGISRWLGVRVGADPEMNPRMRIVSTAYAYQALRADTARYALGVAGSHWFVADSVLYTDHQLGLARGNAGNTIYGTDKYNSVNLGTNSTTGTYGQYWSAATVTGGDNNTAGGYGSFIGGGSNNQATAEHSLVTGGANNSATGQWSIVSGGWQNNAGSYGSTTGGGTNNSTWGVWAGVSAGYHNQGGDNADDTCAFVGGGFNNHVTAKHSTIAGGMDNTAGNFWTTITGGNGNTATGWSSTIGGGTWNQATGDNSVVAGGFQNVAAGYISAIGGGYRNRTTNTNTTVAGGADNLASGWNSTVGGGYLDSATGDISVVGGGLDNTASGYGAVVSGGEGNANAGQYAAIPGGEYDTLGTGANYSLLFGYRSYLNTSYQTSFFNSRFPGRFGVNRDDRDGGIQYPIHVGTNTSNGNGAYLTNGGTWTSTCSRETKENFEAVDEREVLEKVADMSVQSWEYKNTTERHIGPVAEDFTAAFDVGTTNDDGTRDSLHISSNDMAGVALVAIKELYRQNRELTDQNAELNKLIRELDRKVKELQARR